MASLQIKIFNAIKLKNPLFCDVFVLKTIEKSLRIFINVHTFCIGKMFHVKHFTIF